MVKSKIFIRRILIVIILTNGYSCQNIGQKTSDGTNLEIISAYKSPIVGGAPGSKGLKIVIELKKTEQIKIDTVEFAGKFQVLNSLKNKSDSFSYAAYFYPSSKKFVGSPAKTEDGFNSNSCKLIYRENGRKGIVLIPKLEYKMDSTMWK